MQEEEIDRKFVLNIIEDALEELYKLKEKLK